MKAKTIQQFFQMFPSDDFCLEHLMEVRYGMEGVCPHCARETKYTRITKRKAYACQWCGHHVYPCVGTPFENSRTSLQSWFYAIYLFTVTRSGLSAKQLERQLGVTYKCAWRMGHEIRKHMAFVDGDPKLSGHVEVDETFIGGYQRGYKNENKTLLFGMLDRDGDVMTKVIPDRKMTTLWPIIQENVEKGSTLHTDDFTAYRSLGTSGYKHKAVNHSAKEYARGESHTNTIESYWSRLKNSINGTHVHVSGKHLGKYAGEFEYRFNSRNHPEEMLQELLGIFLSPKNPSPSKK